MLQSHEDAQGGMALFAGGGFILNEDLVDESFDGLHFGASALGLFAFRREGALDCLPYHAPMDMELIGKAANGAAVELIVAANLFE